MELAVLVKALDAGGRGTQWSEQFSLLMYSRTVSRTTDVTMLLHYMAKQDMEKSGNGSKTAVPGYFNPYSLGNLFYQSCLICFLCLNLGC